MGLSKVGSLGDLTSLFELSTPAAVAAAVAEKSLPAAPAAAAPMGVDTPPLSSCDDEEDGAAEAMHVPDAKRARIEVAC